MNSEYTQLKGNINAVIDKINDIAPRYHQLKNKEEKTIQEAEELKEIEQFLIDVSPKLEKLKNHVNHDLYGMSVDFYYMLKSRAQKGDTRAKKILDEMSPAIKGAMSKSAYEHWN